jgi:hypothetical protein
MEEMTPIRQISNKKKVPNQQLFLYNIHKLPKIRKISTRKYILDLYKEIFMEEITPIRQILKKII